MEPRVIFEDANIIVIDKPSGWITNVAKTTGKSPVLQTWIGKNFKFEISNLKFFRNGIVHRLDKETSGILLVAKTKKAFEDLQKQFKDRKVEKIYTALVHGKVELKEGEIDAPVGRLPWNRERFGVLPGGRKATTHYKVDKYLKVRKWLEAIQPVGLDRFAPLPFSLVKLYPKTGRTHQIRIHLKHIGHPVVSDEFYAGRKRARNDRKWCPRLFLHASGLTITHSSKKHVFKSKLPADLVGALNNLRSLGS